jgi:SAM-dependent methyltransferase
MSFRLAAYAVCIEDERVRVARYVSPEGMGRFSVPLAGQFTAWLRLAPGQRVLDVGCGPGALTAILVARLGADSVSAVDPSESFVTAARERMPGVDVRRGAAEALPWPDEAFDCAVAQLVVHLMADPPAGISEMARVTRPGGTVAATVWDFAGGAAPVSAFWRAAQEVVPTAPGEAGLPGAHEGQHVRPAPPDRPVHHARPVMGRTRTSLTKAAVRFFRRRREAPGMSLLVSKSPRAV